MSELIQSHDNRATIRWKLLTGASALALIGYVSATAAVRAEDSDRPSLWIELGGHMEMAQGLSSPFTAPFTLLTPTPDPYRGESPTSAQRAPRYSLGLDGEISFRPEDSDWSFSAGIRYGRSHANRHVHAQTTIPQTTKSVCITPQYCLSYHNFHLFNKVADTKALHSERHAVLDFQASKDIGLGLLGRDGASSISAGVRIAQFTEKMAVDIYARPDVGIAFPTYYHVIARDSFNQYFLHAHAARSFKGIGPSLSWSASTALAGNAQDGEIMLDWGVDPAILFGRQKARTAHTTSGYHFEGISTRPPLYPARYNHSTRARSVAVPNLGGSLGVSVKYPNAKISIGYRYDTFLSAMDTGIDTAKKSNLTFNGPYASISIGIGN